jgi:hypothetical protein
MRVAELAQRLLVDAGTRRDAARLAGGETEWRAVSHAAGTIAPQKLIRIMI